MNDFRCEQYTMWSESIYLGRKQPNDHLWQFIFNSGHVYFCCRVLVYFPGLEVIKIVSEYDQEIPQSQTADKLEFILRLKIKRNDWLLTDTCPQAAKHSALF